MPRFVVLQHDSPQGTHFDLMLEAGDVLKTWALPEPPRSGIEVQCHRLPDHRPAYLDYEGPVSEDRGTVHRWDHGVYETARQSEQEWIVDLSGRRLRGLATLRLSTGEPRQWQFSFAES